MLREERDAALRDLRATQSALDRLNAVLEEMQVGTCVLAVAGRSATPFLYLHLAG